MFLLPHTNFYSRGDSGGLTQCQFVDRRLKIANDLVVSWSMISLFFFLAFHWLTFYHITPFRIKPGLVATRTSEHVSFSDEGPLLETLEFFPISYSSYQPSNYLLYAIFVCLHICFSLFSFFLSPILSSPLEMEGNRPTTDT